MVGVGQGLNGRESFQKRLVVSQYGRDSCLLQHDFGDPLGIGVAATSPPGKIASMAVVPREQLPPYRKRNRIRFTSGFVGRKSNSAGHGSAIGELPAALRAEAGLGSVHFVAPRASMT